MQIMNNGARSAEVVNYQGSGAAKLRRDLAYKVARVAMRIDTRRYGIDIFTIKQKRR